MTLNKYRTTKLPAHYFREIEAVLSGSDKYVSVSEFLRLAVDEKLAAEKRKELQDTQFLVLKDLVFTKSRLLKIHEAVANKTRVDSKDLLKKDMETIIERSIDTDLFRFLSRFMHNFMKYHPFKDGNKRTAFVAADIFLRLNNKRLVLKADKKKKTPDERFIWQASIQQKKPADIGKFLEKHAKHYLSSNDFDTELHKCLEENRQLLENLSE